MTSLMPKQVGVLVGSLRRGSFSRKLAKALIARAPAGLDCKIIEIADLALYKFNAAVRRFIETCPASARPA